MARHNKQPLAAGLHSQRQKDIPKELDAENYHALRGGFTALVYAAADNTLHLVTMYYGAKLLMP